MVRAVWRLHDLLFWSAVSIDTILARHGFDFGGMFYICCLGLHTRKHTVRVYLGICET